jgi:hypothetical protein
MDYNYIPQKLDIFTGVWLTFWLIYSIVKVVKGKRNIIYIAYWEFYIFFAGPLIMDIFNGPFEYKNFMQGFILATRDLHTNILTDIFLILCPIIFFLFGRDKRAYKDYKHQVDINGLLNQLKGIRFIIYPLLWIMMASPLILTLSSGQASLLTEYGFSVKILSQGIEGPVVWGTIFTLSFLSVLSAGIYTLLRKRLNIIEIIFMFLFVTLAIFVNGKRNIVAITAAIFLIVNFVKGRLNGKKLFLLGSIIAIGLAFYSSFYLLKVKDFTSSNGNVTKTMYIDNGRTDRVKMAIYSTVNPEELSIVNYTGQTVLYELFFFIPRSLWESKGYPYHLYFTNKLIYPDPYPTSYEEMEVMFYGGMTTSFLDEAIANFSWGGFLIGPLVIALISRLGDRQPSVLKLLTLYIVLQLLRTEPNVIQLWIWILATVTITKYYKRYLANYNVSSA